MTETEWLRSDAPFLMLQFLRVQPRSRKCLLLTAACARRLWEKLSKQSRDWFELMEVAAEGKTGIAGLSENESSASNDLLILDRSETRPFAPRGKFRALFDICRGQWQIPSTWEQGNLDWVAERAGQAVLVRDVFGIPFRLSNCFPRWRSLNALSTVTLARSIYYDRAYDRLPILADLLEEAGCSDADILDHCRGPGPHVRGCWVVDLILGKS